MIAMINLNGSHFEREVNPCGVHRNVVHERTQPRFSCLVKSFLALSKYLRQNHPSLRCRYYIAGRHSQKALIYKQADHIRAVRLCKIPELKARNRTGD
jgi:hypothetical protein